MKYLLVTTLSVILVACGSSRNNFTNTSSGSTDSLTTAQKQVIGILSVESLDILDIAAGVFDTTERIGSLFTENLSCVSGNGTQRVVNTLPLDVFNVGDSIVVKANNCVVQTFTQGFTETVNQIGAINVTLNATSNVTSSTINSGSVNGLTSKTVNGEVSYIGSTTGITTTFINSGTLKANLNGILEISPTVDYSPVNGTGSLQIIFDRLILTNNQANTIKNQVNNITYRNGSNRFSLTGNNYTNQVNYEIASNLFSGSVRLETEANGFTGTTSIFGGKLAVSNPLSGMMNIRFPDGSSGVISADTGNHSTYNLTIDNQTTTVLWDR